MSRIFFWLALVFLVVSAVRSKLREGQQRQQRGSRPPQAPPGVPPQPQQSRQARAAEKAIAEAETMLCCAHCGIYYPASETVRANGLDYCSSAHAGLPAA